MTESMQARTQELFDAHHRRIVVSTDRMFAALMLIQWVAGILAALIISPRTWAGSTSSTHIHVWSAVICGGLISSVPIFLALRYPGRKTTRYTIAAAQMLWSALLIHLTGGRIETHFHIFGSLAFLAFYRDWKVLIPATIVIAADHAIRGVFWPQSVYGVLSATPLRWFEHAAWVVFEDVFLIRSCRQSIAEMWDIARQRNELEGTNERIEQEVKNRTEELRDSLAWKATVLESAADGIITIDSRGMIQEFNSAAERIFGYRREQLLGSNVSMLMPEPDNREHDTHLQRYQETGIKTIIGTRREVVGVHEDGSPIPLDLHVSEVQHGDQRSFTGIVRDLTEQRQAQAALAKANDDLREVSRRAGMAEIATGVLHNVGNVLNSVNVSASIATDSIRASRLPGLNKAVSLIKEHSDDLGRYLTENEKGRQLPRYLEALAEHLSDSQGKVVEELESLTQNVEHIKSIVGMQQSYAGLSGVIERVSVNDMLDDAYRMNSSALERHRIRFDREYAEDACVEVDKQKLLQILINVLRNAKHAMHEREDGCDARLTLRTRLDEDRVRIEATDNGVGIPPEHLTKIFAHGFTTRKHGHGFGLHHSALLAREMGGSLTAHSEGAGKGATFVLELPLKVGETVQ